MAKTREDRRSNGMMGSREGVVLVSPEAQRLTGAMPYLAPHEFRHVPNARRELPLWTAVVALSLFDLDQLLIQSLLLQKQPLGLPSLHTQLLLQGQDHPVFAFDLIHLEKKARADRHGEGS